MAYEYAQLRGRPDGTRVRGLNAGLGGWGSNLVVFKGFLGGSVVLVSCSDWEFGA